MREHEREASGGVGIPPSSTTMVLRRPRLEDRLDRFLTASVIVVQGPAGAGKTTLVQAWVAGRTDGRVRAARWFGEDDGSGVETRDRALNDGGRGSGVPEVVVLDDVRDLRGHAVWTWAEAASRERRQLVLVVTTREVGSDVALRGLNGHVVRTIRASDLAFTATEAAELVRLHWPGATTRDVRRIHALTRGWAALVVVAAEQSAARELGDDELLQAVAGDPTAARVLAESVRTLPEQARAALLALVQGDEVDPSASAASTAPTETPAQLATLAEHGLIARRQRGDHTGRRSVNPVLRAYLRPLVQPQSTSWPLLAISHAHHLSPVARLGDPVIGVEHAMATGRTDVLVAAVAEHGPSLLAVGRFDLFTQAQQSLPQSERSQNPSLLAVEALQLRAIGDVEGALDAARAAAQRAAAAPTVHLHGGIDVRLRGDLATLALWQARQGWVDPVEPIDVAERLVAEMDSVGAQLSIARRAWLALELGSALLWSGEVAEAAMHFERARTLLQGSDHRRFRAAALSHRSLAELVDGSFQAAVASAEEARNLAAADGHAGDVYLTRANLAQAWVAFYRLEPWIASRYLDAVDGHRPQDLDPLVHVLSRLLRARLQVEHEGYDNAWEALTDRGVARPDLPAFLWRWLLVARAEVHVARRDVSGLQLEVEELQRRGEADEADLFRAVGLLLSGDPGGGLRSLKVLVEKPVLHVTTGVAAAACYVGVLAAAGHVQARAALRDLLSRIWSTGAAHFLLLAVSAGPAVVELLQREADDPDGHPYAGEALRRVNSATAAAGPGTGEITAESGAPAAAEAAGPVGAELTPRELAVLQCLAGGMSYSEVARTLYITPNTVKTHVQSLYRKLGVDRAAHAVMVAREHGMVPESS